jgi:glycosyltransferase involved in cell wall biosynthesis
MRVLFTSPILEHPAVGGPQLRIENSIKALSRVCDLWVISRAPGSVVELESTKEFFRPYCRGFTILPQILVSAKDRSLASRVRRWVSRKTGFGAVATAKFLLRYADEIGADVLWFGYGNISYPVMRAFRRLRPNLKIVCDTDSVWSRFVLRELPYATGERRKQIAKAGKKKEAEEREWVDFCDVTTAVSEVDAEYYRGLTNNKAKIHLFPNVIDVDSYRQPPPAPDDFSKPAIFLAGSFGRAHSPMDMAARWMLEEVFPLLRERIPGVHFYIVGNNSDRSFGHLNGPNTTATGRLESVLPYLCHANVALVPLKYESGTRFKILEAGACSVPLVSTTLGAEGIPVIDGEHILIADDASGFASAILRLLEDKELANMLAANCNRLVCKQFSVDALAKDASRILEYLDEQKNGWRREVSLP